MKKIFLTAVMAISTVALFAQGQTQGQSQGSSGQSSGLTSKKGEMFLPEAGDWAISFDASPFLNYFGNFLSSKGNTAPVVSFLNTNNTIIGKYFVDNQTAYRALVRIGIDHQGVDNIVNQDGSTSTPPATVTDHASFSQHFIGLGAGMEKRKGKTRLQGYYGAEFMFFLAGSGTTYTYGNAFSSSDQLPTSTSWTGTTATSVGPVNSRTLDNKAGSTFGIALQGFIGFEYFFMPKISVGGEYTWGISFQSTGQGTVTTEAGNGSTSTSTTTHTGGNSFFGLDDGLNTAWGASNGNLYIHFHF